MKKIALSIMMLGLVSASFSQTKVFKNKFYADSVSPLIKIANEPRFLINVHSAYSMGLGSTFKFYPDDVSSIYVEQIGSNTGNKTVAYANPAKGLGDGFKYGFGASCILNDFSNFGIDFDYFKSTIKKNRDSSYYSRDPTAGNGLPDEYQYKERNTVSYEATLLSINP
jgi:hypothetical protein